MPFPAAPWVIGPVPIILTVWAAYACGIAVVKQRPTTGEAFLAAFLLPGGLTSIACQLFLSHRNFTALLIGNQFVSSAFFFIVMHASGMRGTPDLTSKETLQRAVKSFVILLTSYIVSNCFSGCFPAPTDARLRNALFTNGLWVEKIIFLQGCTWRHCGELCCLWGYFLFYITHFEKLGATTFQSDGGDAASLC